MCLQEEGQAMCNTASNGAMQPAAVAAVHCPASGCLYGM